MEKMAYKYDEQAEKNNSIIVSGVHVESVPSDLGVEFLFQHFNGIFRTNRHLKKKSNQVPELFVFYFSGELKNVDMYKYLYLSKIIFTVSNIFLFVL